jgi:hypothetical protein
MTYEVRLDKNGRVNGLDRTEYGEELGKERGMRVP